MACDANHRHTATLKDIAAMAEVSSMTVSNFINGKFHTMSAETRENLVRYCRNIRTDRTASREISGCRGRFP